ncbi:MAG: hypothetical protein KatS3mg038_1538 [Candidatus Kapaibacterium sp.]|jgi:uncharacterized protein YprB with RNaseH-like and TPR domain|nr:MAG: hypothetical protein KatS3mg038_1538 [Candidatus Kapabacteria bacterium]
MKRRIKNKRKLLAFDIETATQLVDFDDEAKRKAGIACAATLAEDEEDVRFFYSKSATRMTQKDAVALVRFLQRSATDGYTIVTWNGASFDFCVLAEESKLYDECAELALHHIDMMFHIVCARGHFLGLDKAARGLGLAGKSDDVKGSDAPALWRDGETQRVLDYLAQDVHMTLQVAKESERRRGFYWQSSTGTLKTIEIDRLLTVTEALKLPVPNASWMKNPPDRRKMIAWTERTKT